MAADWLALFCVAANCGMMVHVALPLTGVWTGTLCSGAFVGLSAIGEDDAGSQVRIKKVEFLYITLRSLDGQVLVKCFGREMNVAW